MNKGIIVDNYPFHFEKQYKDHKYYRCLNYGINCWTRGIDDGVRFKLSQPHFCDPIPNAERKQACRAAAKSKVTLTSKPKEIYEQLEDEFPDVIADLPFEKLTYTLQKERQKIRGQIPPNARHGITEMQDILQAPEWQEKMKFDGGAIKTELITDVTGDTSLIIWDKNFIENFHDADMFAIDATFAAVPSIDKQKNLRNYQLLNVRVLKDNVPYQVASVIMTRKTTRMYTAVFEIIFKNFKNYTGFIIMDYEKGMRNAISSLLRKAGIIGCFFHIVQALRKMAKKLKLQKILKEDSTAEWIMRKIELLALLPAKDIEKSFDKIVEKMGTNYRQIFGKFLSYFKRTWIYGYKPAAFTVYEVKHKTNNFIESYHARLKHAINKHPSMWGFAMEIVKITSKDCKKLKNVKEGKLVKAIAVKSLYQICDLKTLWLTWRSETISLEGFMLQANTIINKNLARQIDLMRVSNDDDDEDNYVNDDYDNEVDDYDNEIDDYDDEIDNYDYDNDGNDDDDDKRDEDGDNDEEGGENDKNEDDDDIATMFTQNDTMLKKYDPHNEKMPNQVENTCTSEYHIISHQKETSDFEVSIIDNDNFRIVPKTDKLQNKFQLLEKKSCNNLSLKMTDPEISRVHEVKPFIKSNNLTPNVSATVTSGEYERSQHLSTTFPSHSSFQKEGQAFTNHKKNESHGNQKTKAAAASCGQLQEEVVEVNNSGLNELLQIYTPRKNAHKLQTPIQLKKSVKCVSAAQNKSITTCPAMRFDAKRKMSRKLISILVLSR